MSSAGRYQSRLFNFFHATTRRFTQQRDQLARSLQFTTSSVAAVVLYPFYLLFQSTRNSAKQFHQAVQQSLSQLPAGDTDSQPLTPPTADTPIQQVLLLVHELPSEEAISTPSPTKTKLLNPFVFLTALRFKLLPSRKYTLTVKSQGPEDRIQDTPTHLARRTSHLPKPKRAVIRGIATQLSSRTLVLVTAQNAVLDTLTEQQQEKLQELIIGEVAEYWRYQRLAHSARQKLTTQLQQPKDQANTKLRLKKSGFVEVGLTNISVKTQINQSNPPVQRSALVFLDRIIAEVESQHLAPVSKAATTLSQRSQKLIRRIQTHIGASLSRGASAAITPNGVETQTIRIQALIWAAIDYFFGDRSRRKYLEKTTPTANSIQATPQYRAKALEPYTSLATHYQPVSDNIQDPWLTLSDLFGDSDQVGEPATLQQSELSNSDSINPVTEKTNKALPANQSAGYFVQKLLNKFQNSLKPQPTSGIVKRQKTTKGKLLEKVSSKRSPVLVKQNQTAIALRTQQPQSQSTQMKPAPDWIETNATAMGYVKHPLEQLLEWLDRAMLWLEEVLIKVLQWVQRW